MMQNLNNEMANNNIRHETLYERYFKRGIDIVCALLALLFFWWLFLVIVLLVKIKLGSPVIFKQKRPGLNENIFLLYKFRTMTDAKDANGNLLSDEMRLTAFGKLLRASSLDELPEVFNILKGDMSIIGPRPQLVRDMVFMTAEQRCRHHVRPGLSGLAQVNGRNSIDWTSKLNFDLEYIKKITLLDDVKILCQTLIKAFITQEGITENDMATSEDFGDYLLRKGAISKSAYDALQISANNLLLSNGKKRKHSEKSINRS